MLIRPATAKRRLSDRIGLPIHRVNRSCQARAPKRRNRSSADVRPPAPRSSLNSSSRRHLLLVDLGEFEHEVDHLVLEDRRAQLRQHLRVVAVVVPDLLFLAGELAGALDQRAAHLFVGDGDVVLLADLRQHEAETHAAVGDLAIVLLRLLLRGVLVGEGAVDRFHLLLDRFPHHARIPGRPASAADRTCGPRRACRAAGA